MDTEPKAVHKKQQFKEERVSNNLKERALCVYNDVSLSLTQIVLPGKHVDAVGGVGAHGEEADHGDPRCRLVPHLLQVEDDSLRVFHSQRLCNVLPCLRQHTVGTPRPEGQRETAERSEKWPVVI